MKRSLQTRKLSLEQLETRRVFAGSVDVSVDDFGDLIISGDDAANGVQIFQAMQNGQPLRGSYRVVGTFAGGAPTTITGQQSPSGVTDDIQINLRGGNDRLVTSTVNLLVADDLNVDLGEGNNVASLDRLRVSHNVNIDSGSGDDNIFVRGSIGIAAHPDSDLRINTRGGADGVFLQNLFVRDDLNINTGLGQFRDRVEFFTGNVGDDVSINTFDGNDSVVVSGVGINDDLTVQTGSGRDTFAIDNSQVDELYAYLGSGDDHVEISSTFGRNVILYGQSGADTIVDPNESLNVSGLYIKDSFLP